MIPLLIKSLFGRALSDAEHITARHFGTLVTILLIVFMALHFWPKPVVNPQPNNQVTQQISSLSREVNAAVSSQQTIARVLNGAVGVLERQGATVVTKVVPISVAGASEVLSATKPRTVQRATLTVSSPKPAPTPKDDFFKKVYDAAYSADTHAISETTLNLKLDQVEAPRSRLGSFIGTNGTGLSYSMPVRKNYEFTLAGVLNNHNGISPAVCGGYKVPHTALAANVCLTSVDHKVTPGFGFVVNY